eukprot:CAMPEP_0172489988 /NCGR_PEP_ID=MMETSP1066-20121228/20286_1 /TAXON_ID=671091 /ORGANISM="Coscinodiscus wailesii, Strain CCMP2513" /LENGTH=244 /DNA_ID=CAMNT_0013258237 /DNA_START=166 /DNA_END=900 /DNA_ORIENTATION=+
MKTSLLFTPLAFSITAQAFTTHFQNGVNIAVAPKGGNDRVQAASSLQISFVDNLFKAESSPKVAVKNKLSDGDVMIKPDYALAIGFTLAGAAILYANPSTSCPADFIYCPSIYGGVAGGLHLLIGAFFAVQASIIRLVFDKNTFSLRRYSQMYELQKSDPNIVLGVGKNTWTYKSIINWEFFPSIYFPILIYFKETQTPKETWTVGPGKYDKRRNGQVHFLPAFADVWEVDEQFRRRGCGKADK